VSLRTLTSSFVLLRSFGLFPSGWFFDLLAVRTPQRSSVPRRSPSRAPRRPRGRGSRSGAWRRCRPW
jgi:hypothetical protein